MGQGRAVWFGGHTVVSKIVAAFRFLLHKNRRSTTTSRGLLSPLFAPISIVPVAVAAAANTAVRPTPYKAAQRAHRPVGISPNLMQLRFHS